MKKYRMLIVLIIMNVNAQQVPSKLHEIIQMIGTGVSSDDGKQIISDIKDLYVHVVPMIKQIHAARNNTNVTTPVVSTSVTATTTVAGVGAATMTQTAGLQLSDKGKSRDMTGIAQLVNGQQGYSEQDVWNLLQSTSPVVYQFGQDHKIALHDLVIYSQMLQQYHIEPATVVEFIKNHNNLDNTKANSWAVDHYTDLKTNQPDTYQTIVLSIIKELFDKEAGANTSSIMNSTHIDLLHGKVTDQQSTIFKTGSTLVASIIVHLCVIAGWITQSQVATGGNSTAFNGTH